ncbi:MAG: hypothetical protein NTZ65_04300 [Candidatus Berkelbacteria bacterium]|nr:hypothetical protein [Candidatus Berkelbacteria bacterium]
MLRSKKLKSFGITEAIVASIIVILVLTAAVALSSSTSRTASADSAYTQAEHISNNLFETINLIKSSGRVSFDDKVSSPNIINIRCFDTNTYKTKTTNDCNKADFTLYPLSRFIYKGLDATTVPDDNYVPIKSNELDDPSFSDGYFAFNVAVKVCPNPISVDTQTVPPAKCRQATIDVKWEEATGVRHFKLVQIFTDWER